MMSREESQGSLRKQLHRLLPRIGFSEEATWRASKNALVSVLPQMSEVRNVRRERRQVAEHRDLVADVAADADDLEQGLATYTSGKAPPSDVQEMGLKIVDLENKIDVLLKYLVPEATHSA